MDECKPLARDRDRERDSRDRERDRESDRRDRKRDRSKDRELGSSGGGGARDRSPRGLRMAHLPQPQAGTCILCLVCELSKLSG